MAHLEQEEIKTRISRGLNITRITISRKRKRKHQLRIMGHFISAVRVWAKLLRFKPNKLATLKRTKPYPIKRRLETRIRVHLVRIRHRQLKVAKLLRRQSNRETRIVPIKMLQKRPRQVPPTQLKYLDARYARRNTQQIRC